MSSSQSEICQLLGKYLLENVLAENVKFTNSMPFTELGIDSVTVIELIIHLDDELGIDVPVDLLLPENLHSIDAIAECAMEFTSKGNS